MCTQWHSVFNTPLLSRTPPSDSVPLLFSPSDWGRVECRAGRQTGDHDWLNQAKARSERKPKKKEEWEEEEDYAHAYTTARLLISTATVFTHSQTSGRRPRRAVSQRWRKRKESRMGRGEWKSGPSSLCVHHPLVSFIEFTLTFLVDGQLLNPSIIWLDSIFLPA